MAKNKVSEWSATPADNTDVGGIDINEGCAPSGINNAIRDIMAQIKDMQTGADGDNFVVGGNLTVNGTTTLATPLPVASGGTGATTSEASRTALGLGTLSTQAANNVAITGGSITGITDLAVADGGTGSSTLTANAVLLGNGTSALQTVAPSTSGNVLTSNGTTWTSSALGVIGIGQSWQNVGGSRAQDVAYTNSTGKPIFVSVSVRKLSNNDAYLYVDGVQAGWVGGGAIANLAFDGQLSAIVPNGSGYYVTGANSIAYWAELR
jgi:hypothetical protein